MDDDIVARLRVLASEFPTVNGWMDNEWKNAADEIERLRARVAKLENELRLEAAFQRDEVQREAL